MFGRNMDNKAFEFNGKAGDFFIVYIIVLVSYLIPIFGWPFGFNYMTNWIVDNTTIRGEKIKYSAAYGETLKFLFINTILTMITFGIYTFWFIPKTYRFIANHTQFAGASAPEPVQTAPTPPITPSPMPPPTTIPPTDSPQSPPTPIVVQ